MSTLSVSFFFLVLSSLIFFIFSVAKSSKSDKSISGKHLKQYPIIGNFLELKANLHRYVQWTSDIIQTSPAATYTLHLPLGGHEIITGNPANVEHILKTHFHIYQKGRLLRSALFDLLGNGIVNAIGDNWKFQRQAATYEFNTKSLRKFVESAVDTELSRRLIPFLSAAAKNGTVFDFQDVLQRFAFDNICKIAFGYDPAYLLAYLPQAKFAQAFEDSVRISFQRLSSPFWRIKRALNIGSEKQLQEAISQVREFAAQIVKKKKQELKECSSLESVHLLSRFLNSGHSDDTFAIDIVINFILAGRDTTSAALTWFFWLLSKHPEVETKILQEIKEKSSGISVFEVVKNMVYTHASLCESMRLYPPVPTDTKVAINSDDVLPDGTVVPKGTLVTYHPYAMGRLEMLWGKDWADFKPERWLMRDRERDKWSFVGRDMYTYPVFQAGPRICLGKEMAFLQMKRVVAGVLSKFRVVPAVDDGFEPEYIAYLTAKMKGGFPVRIEERGN